TYDLAGLSPFKGSAGEIVRKEIAKQGGEPSSPADWRKLWDPKSPPPAEPPGIPGYRVDRKVCVVSWPDRKAVGCSIITGEEPPASVYVDKDAKEYRNTSLARLEKWWRSLPRVSEGGQ